jgi:flagellar hook-associated protein 2
MSGVTSGVGIFSGIDSASIIQQLMQLEARPKQQIQGRIVQLQAQLAAYLDINTRLSALRTAAKAFRESQIFRTRSATSSNADVLTATAGPTSANGTYQFIVDRLVSTQQVLSRGFVDSTSSAVGITSLTLESAAARLDRNVSLRELNNGAGIERGRIIITDSAGATATIDLSRATHVSDVLEAINGNGTARITARVEGGRFVITDNAGGTGTMTISNAIGSNTATSLGIAGSAAGGTITGSNVYGLHAGTQLNQLNDGRGVYIRNVAGEDAHSFRLIVDDGSSPVTVFVNLGEVWEYVTPSGGGDPVLTRTAGAVTTMQGVLDRIASALADAGVSNVSASIDATNGRLVITDSTGTRTLRIEENGATTAADLGLGGLTPGSTLNGRRILAGLNTTLGSGLNGGSGIAGDGVLNFTLRTGQTFSVTIDPTASLTEIFRQIEQASDAGTGARVRVELDPLGTGLVVTDLTGGAGNFIITGTAGQDSAESLGISTGAGGVAASTVRSGNLQRQYISLATSLASLNGGRGIGTGTFRMTDAQNVSATVTVTDSHRTVGDLINLINSRGLNIEARINANGDGIEIIETVPSGGSEGGARIRIADESGAVARNLNLAGTSAGTGTQNIINGSYERTVTFSAADTLTQVMEKINAANAGVVAAIVRDGSESAPFRLTLTSQVTGTAGRFIIDTGTFDLGIRTLDAGQDARVFFGSTDPARGIAVSSSTNAIDTLLPGVRLDLKGVSANPVSLTIQTDTAAIEQSVKSFLEAFNTVVGRIDFQSRYDSASNQRGPLLGDGIARELRSALYSVINAPGIGISGQFSRLADVGIRVGQKGVLELDEERFREALQQDPAGVEALFVTRTQASDETIDIFGDGTVIVRNPNAGSSFSALGVMGQVEELVKRYIEDVSGILSGRTKSIEDQIKSHNNRIAAMDVRLAQKQAVLERKFRAMEAAIGQMQTQQAALASLSSRAR